MIVQVEAVVDALEVVVVLAHVDLHGLGPAQDLGILDVQAEILGQHGVDAQVVQEVAQQGAGEQVLDVVEKAALLLAESDGDQVGHVEIRRPVHVDALEGIHLQQVGLEAEAPLLGQGRFPAHDIEAHGLDERVVQVDAVGDVLPVVAGGAVLPEVLLLLLDCDDAIVGRILLENLDGPLDGLDAHERRRSQELHADVRLGVPRLVEEQHVAVGAVPGEFRRPVHDLVPEVGRQGDDLVGFGVEVDLVDAGAGQELLEAADEEGFAVKEHGVLVGDPLAGPFCREEGCDAHFYLGIKLLPG